MMEKLKDRYTILAISLLLAGTLMISQLVNLQVIHGKEYDDQSQRRLLKERTIAAPRGNIVDRNGVPIAVNRLGFTVQMVKTKMDNSTLNDMILKLVNIFEKNNDTYYKSLNKYLTFNPIAFGTSISQSDSATKKWISQMVLASKDANSLNTAQDVFNYFRKKKFNIKDSYTDEEAHKIMTIRYEMLMKGYTALNPLYLAKDASRETVAEVEERHDEFPGVTTDIEPMRKYVDGQDTAQVVGYVRGLDPTEYIRLKDEGYGMNDIIGKSGVELAAEKYLKGKDGQKKVEVDTSGRLTEDLQQENPAIPGDDVVLTLDTRLQKVAMDSLAKNIQDIRQKGGKNNFGDASAGAVVAIDVKTGEVLSMASYPSYDPSIFLEGADNKDAQKAISDLFDPKNEGKPAFNRAISGIYAPGSTFKPVVGIAGLEEKVITPDSIIYDSGTAVIGGMTFECLEYKNGLGAHGPLNIERAIATSCNIFFNELGSEVGIDNIDKWAKYFGLGQKTGIDVDPSSESSGVLASKSYKLKAYKDDWRPADTAQSAIGQFYNAFTPLQLANYIATIANGGKRFTPYIVKRVIKYDGSTVTETKPQFEQIPIDQAAINAVQKGMTDVIYSVEGTATGQFDDLVVNGQKITVAGKTGTAETGNEATHSSNALFVCYAPAEDPQIAVAVVVERGAWGANTAPIAHDVLMEYFGVNNKDIPDDKIKPGDVQLTH